MPVKWWTAGPRRWHETGETIWVSAPSGLFAVFLDVAESPAAVRYAARPGKRVPIHVTATGQALMSQMPDRDRDLKLLCEQIAEDFLKNQEAESQ